VVEPLSAGYWGDVGRGVFLVVRFLQACDLNACVSHGGTDTRQKYRDRRVSGLFSFWWALCWPAVFRSQFSARWNLSSLAAT